MKIYTTKYALTSGIKELDAVVDGSVAIVRPAESGCFVTYYHGSNWHTSMEEAVKKAEKMRSSKIARLQKQIAKLESIKF